MIENKGFLETIKEMIKLGFIYRTDVKLTKQDYKNYVKSDKMLVLMSAFVICSAIFSWVVNFKYSFSFIAWVVFYLILIYANLNSLRNCVICHKNVEEAEAKMKKHCEENGLDYKRLDELMICFNRDLIKSRKELDKEIEKRKVKEME